MKKIAILGCENSHADAFVRIIQEKYPDIEVVGVYSDEAEPPRLLHEKYGVPVMNHFADAVGQADGVVITARHGDNHLKYARPYLPTGVPMFIDKPITIDPDEALTLVAEAKQYGVRLTGGSSCKHAPEAKALREAFETAQDGKTVGGLVRAPLHASSPYGGFYFYAQHLTEIAMSIFGRYPARIYATDGGDHRTVIFRYDGFDVSGVFLEDNYRYYAARLAEKGEQSAVLQVNEDCYAEEFAAFAALLNGAPQTETAKHFLAPVFVMNAMAESFRTGREVSVSYPETLA